LASALCFNDSGVYILSLTSQLMNNMNNKWMFLDFDCLLTHFLPSKLCTTYSYVHSQTENNRKIHVNFANHTFKTCGRKLPVTSLADFCRKRSIKLLAIVKTKVYTKTTSEARGFYEMS
jgi:hypothetical protein